MVILGVSWWHMRARIHSGFSQSFSPTVSPTVVQGSCLYLLFVELLVDRQIPVGCLYEQMAVRNT